MQNKLTLNNKETENELNDYFFIISETAFDDDHETILQEIDCIFDKLDNEDKATVLNYMKVNFNNYTFLQKGHYLICQDENFCLIQQKQDYKRIYMELKSQKDCKLLMDMLKIEEFCSENSIPKIFSENLNCLSKIDDQLFDLLDLLDYSSSKKQVSQFTLLKQLLRFFIENIKNSYDSQFLDQIIGSLLRNEIYQFQYFVSRTQAKYNEQFDQCCKAIQQKQLQLSPIDMSKQQFLEKKELAFLFTLLTSDIKQSRQNLKLSIINLLSIQEEHLDLKTIYSRLDDLIIADFDIENLFFGIVYYFWIQYSLQFKLIPIIENIEISFKQIQGEKGRKLKISGEQKKLKQLNDEILTYLVDRVLYFMEDFENSQLIEYYKKFKKEQEELLQVLTSLSASSFENIICLKEEDFLSFWLTLQQLQLYIILQNSLSDINLRQLIILLWILDIDSISYSVLSILFKKESQKNILFYARKIQQNYQSKSKQFIKNFLTLVSNFYHFDPLEQQLVKQIILLPNAIQSGEKILQFNQILQKEKKTLEDILCLKELTLSEQSYIKVLFDEKELITLTFETIQIYKENICNHHEGIFTILRQLLCLINTNRSHKLTCFKILSRHEKLFQILFILNKELLPNPYQVKLTLKIIFALQETLSNKCPFISKLVLKNLQFIIGHQFYNFHYIINYGENAGNQIIYQMILAHYFKQANNINLLKEKCEEIFIYSKQFYKDWLLPLEYFGQFQITPQMFNRQQLFNQYPLNMQISVENFNISFTELTKDEQIEIISNWVYDMKNRDKFFNLIPFFFNIIKREENHDQFLQSIFPFTQKHNKSSYNMKALFQILFNNSNEELKFILLKFRSKQSPIPLIYLNLQKETIEQEEYLYQFNSYIYYIFPESNTIINFSLSKKIKRIGKTWLINKIFYKNDEIFEVSDTNEINENTIDIMFDYSFLGTRNFAIADAHGQIPISVLKKILPLFNLLIIQMDTESEIKENIEYIKQLQQDKIISRKQKICFVIRNSIPECRQRFNKLINEITEINLNIFFQFVQDLTKQFDKQILENEIEQVSKFFFTLLGEIEDEKVSQKDFLSVVKSFKTQIDETFKFLESDQQFVLELEAELTKLSELPDGFYNPDAFPIRASEYLRQLQDDEMKNKCLEKKQIKKKQQEMYFNLTKLLKSFWSIFQKDNYYIQYLIFADKIKIFNEKTNKKLLIENDEINEEISKLNKQIQTLEQDRQTNISQLEEQRAKKQQFQNRLNQNLQQCKLKNIDVNIFWREIIQLNSQSICNQFKNPTEITNELIKKGEAIELIDGDNFKINIEFLQSLTKSLEGTGQEKILSLSILGPQSSGKSTILNKIFGCHFQTSMGKCTKGVQLQLLKIHNKKYFKDLFDYILLLDTEGLQNSNQKDQDFDKKIAVFILAVSHIVLINVRGDMLQQFRTLIEMCIYQLAKMNNNYVKQLNWWSNLNGVTTDKHKFYEEIQEIISNLNRERDFEFGDQIDYNQILDIKMENIEILGISSIERSWNLNWKEQILNKTFASQAYTSGAKIIKNYIEKNFNQEETTIKYFIANANAQWRRIQMLSDLLEFSELVQLHQDKQMKKLVEELFQNEKFSYQSQMQNDILSEIQKAGKLNMNNLKQLKSNFSENAAHNLEGIKEQMKQTLEKIKIKFRIQEKVMTKYQQQLVTRIKNAEREDIQIINDVFANYERECQERQGFAKIDKFVSEISSKPELLQQYSDQPDKIEDLFNSLWEGIIREQTQQWRATCDEYQITLYGEIRKWCPCYFLNQPNQNDQDHFNKLKQVNLQENDKNFEILKESLILDGQFQSIGQNKNEIRYMDIYSEQILDKLQLQKKDNLIDLKDYFKFKLTIRGLQYEEAEKYLNENFVEDLYEYHEHLFNQNNKNEERQSKLTEYCNVFKIFFKQLESVDFENLMVQLLMNEPLFQFWIKPIVTYFGKIISGFDLQLCNEICRKEIQNAQTVYQECKYCKSRKRKKLIFLPLGGQQQNY